MWSSRTCASFDWTLRFWKFLESMAPIQRMARCIVGLGGPRSADYPFRRVHIGRAFVEHVAVAHDFPVWRPLSSALSDVCEQDGVVLCRLWPIGGEGSVGSVSALHHCLRHFGVRRLQDVVVVHAEFRRLCGRFGVECDLRSSPEWFREAAKSLSLERSRGDIKLLQIGVGSQNRISSESFQESPMSGKEAAAITDSVFPACYEWIRKSWFGPATISQGAVFRKVLAQDVPRRSTPWATLERLGDRENRKSGRRRKA
jgi:hypothetical protein